MPGNVAAAAPTDVFPTVRYSGFTIELRLEAISNSYQDGTSERLALVVNPRHFFRLQFTVATTNYNTLRNFYLAHQGTPFYFYDLLDALPGPPPGDPIGRYVVVFDGAWTETLQLGRTQVSVNLREVA